MAQAVGFVYPAPHRHFGSVAVQLSGNQ